MRTILLWGTQYIMIHQIGQLLRAAGFLASGALSFSLQLWPMILQVIGTRACPLWGPFPFWMTWLRPWWTWPPSGAGPRYHHWPAFSSVADSWSLLPLSKFLYQVQSVEQHTTKPSSRSQYIFTAEPCNSVQLSATQCNSVQLSATQCNSMQLSATQCNSVQLSATQCNSVQLSATAGGQE